MTPSDSTQIAVNRDKYDPEDCEWFAPGTPAFDELLDLTESSH